MTQPISEERLRELSCAQILDRAFVSLKAYLVAGLGYPVAFSAWSKPYIVARAYANNSTQD